MNKKIKILIITIIIVLVLVIIGIVLCKTNNTYKDSFEIDDYTISVKANKKDVYYNDMYYTTEFIIKENYINHYNVDFIEVKENEEDFIYDISAPDLILEVKDKKFNCYYDKESAISTVYLDYEIPNENESLIIRVTVGGIFTKDGQQLKTITGLKIDDKVLKSNELKKILDFKIEKKD